MMEDNGDEADNTLILLKRKSNFYGFIFQLETQAIALKESLSLIRAPWKYLLKCFQNN